jgi:hypothetical protein
MKLLKLLATGVAGVLLCTNVAWAEEDANRTSEDRAAQIRAYRALEAAKRPTPPANWQLVVDGYLESTLKDPYSAMKKVVREPRRTYVRPDFLGRETWDGWAVCYSINAKNSYGGYTGAKPYMFVISPSGELVGAAGGGGEFPRYEAALDKECSQPAPSVSEVAQAPAAP